MPGNRRDTRQNRPMARGRGQKHTAKPGDLREHSWATPVEVRRLTPEELEQRKQQLAAKRGRSC